MPLIPRRRKPGNSRVYSARRSLRAAAVAADPAQNSRIRQLHQPWQTRAFGYYDMLGECWNPAQFYARGMAKIRYFPAVQNDDGSLEEIEGGLAVEALKDIEHVAGEYGRLMFLVGEGRLCQSRPPEAEPDSDIVWEFLSPTEVAEKDEGRSIVRNDTGTTGGATEYVNISNLQDGGEPQPGEMRMWRMWRRHPRNSGLADSPVRPVLDLYEQLWWITAGERADIQSRIADNGILLIPNEMDFGPATPEDQAADDDPENDPFQEQLGDTMMSAISDPGSAAASVPLVLRGPAEMLHPDRLRLLHTHDPAGSMFASQREEALIRRIAMGLDLPVEEVLGMSEANHWTAWKVEDQKWQHLEPIATLFSTDIAAVYLRPLLRANGEDADNVVVGYDNSAFARDPDKGKTAITLHSEGLLSAEKTLEANGWTVEDQMPEDEYEDWLAIQLKTPELLGTVEPPESPEPAAPGPAEVPSDDAEEAPPAENRGAPPPDANRDRVIAYALTRARATAGALARSRKRSCPECFDGMTDVKNDLLLWTLGRTRVERLGPAVEFVNAATKMFVSTLADLGYRVDPLVAHGYFTEAIFADGPWPADRLDAIRGL